MIFPGYFSKASIARIGDLPSGIGSNTRWPGIGGGCDGWFGIGGGVFMVFFVCLVKDVQECMPYGFVEVATQKIVTKKLYGERRRTDKRPQIPRELRAKKKVTREPTE